MQQRVVYGAIRCVRSLKMGELAILTSFRATAIAGDTLQGLSDHAAQKLGSHILARQLGLIVAAIGDVWADPFVLSRPCCGTLTYDEVTLIGMVRTVAAPDRSAFNELLCDMLAEDSRDFLYGLFRRFSQTILETAPVSLVES